MIKPDAMKKGHAGAILDKIIKAGFRIVALKQTRLSKWVFGPVVTGMEILM